MLRVRVIFLFILAVHFSAYAQNPIYSDPYLKFDQLTKKNGLTSNYILDIYQDREGYIWVATNDGLNKYNGYTFETFINLPGDSLSISDNLISSLAEDDKGNLFIGTKKGLNLYNKKSNTFTTQIKNFQFPDTLSTEFIRKIYPDSNNIMWIETASGKLVKVKTATGDMQFYEHSPPTMVDTYFYHALHKDPNGQLWLGGRYMGLFRFDQETEEFHIIHEDPNDITKKRDNDVAIYFEDSEGTFWVGGIDGLYTMDRSTEAFTKKIPISTFGISEDRNQLWIATGSGLFTYDLQTKEFSNSLSNDNNQNSIVNDHLNKIFIDRAGNIWLGSISGISIFRPSKNKFKHYYHIAENPNTPVSNHITAILQDNQNRIWLGSANKGVEFFDEHLNKLGDYNFANNNKFNLASDRISTMMVDKDDDIWMGQWSGRGFNIVNPDKGTNIHHSLLKNSLKADWYSDFMQSSKGDFWIGMWGSTGLFRFDKKTGAFMNNRYIAPFTNVKMPVYNIIFDGNFLWLNYKRPQLFFCFSPEKEKYYTIKRENYFEYNFKELNDLWYSNNKTFFKTDNGTYTTQYNPYLSIIKTTNRKNKTIDKKTAFIDLFPQINITSVIEDNSGYYWIGSNYGLHKTDEGKIIASYNRTSMTNDFFPSDTILSLEFVPPETLWLGTEKGLAKFNTKTLEVIDYSSLNNKYLSSHLIKFIFEDSQQNIWVGTTNKGLNKLNPGTGNIRQYPNNLADSNSFWGKEATCMIEDRNGTLWIGGNGLNKYLPATDGFYHYTTANGLVNNELRGILEDGHGYLWISTANGLSKFDPEKETFTNYYEKDGLQENEFSGACFKLNDGRLAFGGKNGLNIFDPHQIKQNETPPSIVLTDFNVFDNPMDTLLKQGESIKLKYDQNYFSFDFAALDFSNPEKNKYAFKLENFHEDWVYTQEGNHAARYTNVDPGNYIFRVKAANSDGFWNEEGISIPVIIHPHFGGQNGFTV